VNPLVGLCWGSLSPESRASLPVGTRLDNDRTKREDGWDCPCCQSVAGDLDLALCRIVTFIPEPALGFGAAEREVEELRTVTERLAAALRQGDFALSEHAGFVTVPLDVLDKLHDHYCGPERSDPVADPLWAELGRYINKKGRKP